MAINKTSSEHTHHYYIGEHYQVMMTWDNAIVFTVVIKSRARNMVDVEMSLSAHAGEDRMAVEYLVSRACLNVLLSRDSGHFEELEELREYIADDIEARYRVEDGAPPFPTIKRR